VRAEFGATPLQLAVMSSAGGACLLLSLAWAWAFHGRQPLPYLVWTGFVARGVFLLVPFISSAWSFVGLVVARDFFGAAAAPAQAAVVERVYPRAQRGRALGTLRMAGAGLGIALALVAGQLFERVGYRWVFVTAAVLGMAASRLRGLTVPNVEPAAGGTPAGLGGAWRAVRDDRAFRRLLIASFLFGLGCWIQTPAHPLLLVDVLQVSPSQVGVFAAVAAVATLAGSAGWGRLVDRRTSLEAEDWSRAGLDDGRDRRRRGPPYRPVRRDRRDPGRDPWRGRSAGRGAGDPRFRRAYGVPDRRDPDGLRGLVRHPGARLLCSISAGSGEGRILDSMRKKVLTALAGALALLVVGSPVWAGPTDQLREYTDQVIKVLDDPSLRPGDRRAAVRKIANEAFDLAETAQRALARHWAARTPAEREEFTQLFGDLLERTYIARIAEYGGERIKYVGESLDGDRAIVRARIVTKSGTEVSVESRMHRRGDRWLIYDVLIENASLVNNYRSQFDRIVRTSSYEELIRRLKGKRDEFMNQRTTGTSG
jgi:phospholipid transport system substrate-binding protein